MSDQQTPTDPAPIRSRAQQVLDNGYGADHVRVDDRPGRRREGESDAAWWRREEKQYGRPSAAVEQAIKDARFKADMAKHHKKVEADRQAEAAKVEADRQVKLKAAREAKAIADKAKEEADLIQWHAQQKNKVPGRIG